MSILLSSNGSFAIDSIKDLIKKPAEQIKVAWITTAAKGGVLSQDYLAWHKEQMQEIGYDFNRVDIEAKNYQELEELARNTDVIFVEGGNVFYLLKAIRQTGFDKIIKKFIDNGGVYIGASAGSYIMCPSIEMGSWKQPERPKYDLTDLAGLNYVPFLIFAHYEPAHDDLLKTKVSKLDYPIRLLQDGQGFLIEKDKITFIGEGEETKLN